jgi:hypothetical protein
VVIEEKCTALFLKHLDLVDGVRGRGWVFYLKESAVFRKTALPAGGTYGIIAVAPVTFTQPVTGEVA